MGILEKVRDIIKKNLIVNLYIVKNRHTTEAFNVYMHQ